MGSRNSTTIPARLTAPTRLTVNAAASVQGSTIACHGVVIKAICPGQTIYVGTASDVTSSTGYPLADGESLTLEVQNVNKLWFIASAIAQSVAIFPYTWV